ncbi:MAG: DUF308 domain-containing protein [Ferruginibacter sp.]
MPDYELIRFAKNESQHSTMESFHLLKSEFESRNLDIGVLEEVETDRLLSNMDNKSNFEKATSIEYTEMIWKFAFDQKLQGKTNDEIFNSLITKGVGEPYAFMLLESLESKSRELVDNFDTEIIVGWILIVAGFVTLYLVRTETFKSIVALYGLLGIIGGIVRLSTSYTKKKKYQTIVNNIQEEKDKLNNLYQ